MKIFNILKLPPYLKYLKIFPYYDAHWIVTLLSLVLVNVTVLGLP